MFLNLSKGKMDTTHINTRDGEQLRAQLGTLLQLQATLPADADLSPVLATGGIPGDWLRITGQSAGDGVTIYVHGGGFAHSKPQIERLMAYRLAQATARPAFRVDYRLAPVHQFPAAVDDVVAVYRALLEQGVPARDILLAGESAGGTLVLSTLLTLKENGDPMPGGALSVSPLTDFDAAVTSQGRDVIDPAMVASLGPTYLGDAPPDQAPQSPAYGDLRGLPPLMLAVGTDELLLQDVRRFAERADEAGVDVTLDLYQDMPHVFHASVLFPPEEQLPVASAFLERVSKHFG
jgi:virginiamycin B lyase